MKIAFTSSGADWSSMIDSRFGRTDYLLLFDEEKEKLTVCDNRSIQSTAHGAGPKTAQKVIELSPDVLITGNGPGGNAYNILRNLNLQIYIGAGGLTVREAYESYQNKQLKPL